MSFIYSANSIHVTDHTHAKAGVNGEGAGGALGGYFVGCFQKRSKNFSMSLRRTALPWVNVILNWYDASATALFPASTNAIAYADT